MEPPLFFPHNSPLLQMKTGIVLRRVRQALNLLVHPMGRPDENAASGIGIVLFAMLLFFFLKKKKLFPFSSLVTSPFSDLHLSYFTLWRL